MSLNATLCELHRILSQLADLRGRLERMPHAVRARQAAVAKLEADLAEGQEAVQQTKMLADRKQLDLKMSEDRIGEWNVQLNGAGSNKEYQTLQEQIAAAEMANSVLADEILETLERIDELETKAKQLGDNLASGRTELDKFIAEVEEKAQTLRGEISRLEGDLATAEKGVSGEVRGDYQRVVRNKGAEGMAATEDGVCSGCGQKITLNQQNDLAMSRAAFCGSCGCLLYLPESS